MKNSKLENIICLYDKYIMPTYTRTKLALAKGKGIYVWDTEANRYLDFFPGWAVSGIGHCHPKVVGAIKKQSSEMIHVSNNYLNGLQARLAKKIIEHSFDGKVFFCNSGAEANEAAFKLVRALGNPKRFEILTFKNSFHGRTLATITATGQDKYKKGFEPLVPGFKMCTFNDINSVKSAVSNETIAILIEPIQGEGGLNVASKEFLLELRCICNEKNIVLIFDEVQTGMGRTGKFFCYQNFGVVPDMMTLAKTLGGGVPVGALVTKRSLADILRPGMHASTFGGGPLVCAASLAVFDAIEKERLLENVVRLSTYVFKKLNILKKKYSIIKEVRGIGLMIGVELSVNGTSVVDDCLKNRLLINCTQGNVLRLMPPLVVKKEEIDKAMNILEGAFKKAMVKP